MEQREEVLIVPPRYYRPGRVVAALARQRERERDLWSHRIFVGFG